MVNEWENVLLEDVATIGDGLHGTPLYDENDQYFFINGNNLKNGKITIDENTKRVNKSTYESLYINFNQKTVFMSINGTIGNVAYFFGEKIVIGKSVAYFNVNNKILPNYLFYQLQTKQLLEYFEETLTGSTIRNLGLNVIRKAKITLPPLHEQHRIAETLSDTDELIAALEKLIAKKRAIKQGTMQELLTGKRRLPGFSEEWIEKKLGDVVDIIMGQSPNSNFYNTTANGLPLIQGNADIENRLTIIRFYTSQITKFADKGDIILTVRAPVGNVAKTDFDCCLGRGVCAIKGNEFIYQYLVYIEPFWSSLSKGSTFDSINSQELYDVVLTLPQDEAEQTAIASILSDMDAEIDTLTAKLNKLLNIKQGMMSELLTGRIRLAENESLQVQKGDNDNGEN